MDLATGDPILKITAYLQQQQLAQFLETYGKIIGQNIPPFFLQTLMNLQFSNSLAVLKESPRNGSKKSSEGNGSMPSPTKRQTKTGKVDKRMIAKPVRRSEEENANKRIRTKKLSTAFDELKNCLPFEEGIRASQVSILKAATEYIGFLGAVLAGDTEEEVNYQERLLQDMESAKTSRLNS
ncbi:hypothetical protein CAEBREN_19888 [Caenorhabditis brenneri]|uniref:BHLH domain-containing protein n=1 Tax=Caenorhabditis brenneri TaxID=135651 RepID=G0NHZ9_CAEBE|nr:hypothetical protein CAEBREN_19888 [Caenorhabditis brenneri]